MHKVNNLISLMMFMGLTLSGCSIQETKKEDTRSNTDGGKTEGPISKDKGRLGLKMPKQDKVPYRALEITLEQSYGCAEPYPMPEPQPSEVECTLEESGDRDVAASAALRSEKYDSSHDDVGYSCDSESTQSYSQTFPYSEDALVSIDDIVPGSYQIHVRLLGEAGETIEEGYGWADVAPGIVTQAYVEIYPTSGNGNLDIQIVRGGDRVDYGDDHGGLCGPSAYQDENGKTRWATCSVEGDEGSADAGDSPVTSDAIAAKK